MSQENVEIVRRCFDVANRGELDAIRDLLDQFMDEEAELRAVGRLPDLPPTVLRGRQAIEEWWEEILEAFDWHVETEEFIDCGDIVVVDARQSARGHGSGAEVVNHIVYLVGLREGKVTYLDAYRTKREALEAAGLSE